MRRFQLMLGTAAITTETERIDEADYSITYVRVMLKIYRETLDVRVG